MKNSNRMVRANRQMTGRGRHRRRIAAGAVALLSWASITPPVAAAQPEEILEVNVTSQPAVKNAQPRVAVNPRNPNNLVLVATNHVPGDLLSQNALGCFVAYSHDRGRSWVRAPWPMGGRPSCGEPGVVVDASGMFTIYNNQLMSNSPSPVDGAVDTLLNTHIGVASSTDQGRTWSQSIETPLRPSGSAPKMRIDSSTGNMYLSGGFGFLFPNGLSVSTDSGRTWSEARPIPMPKSCVSLPIECGFPGSQIAVHDGIFVTALQTAGAVSLEVSTDDGRSYSSRPVRRPDGTSVVGSGSQFPYPGDPGGGVDPVPYVTADPTKSGRFALMLPRGDSFEIYTTNDTGLTWAGPSLVHAEGWARPWIEFGPDGQLGIMWRTAAVDAFATISRDGGSTFAAPLKVNRASQPLSDSYPPGDDLSGIVLDEEYAYVTWNDGRSGGSVDAIFARVPLSLF